jgi:hypothetical protein
LRRFQAPLQRIAAARRALDHRDFGELGEALLRHPGKRRERGQLLGGGARWLGGAHPVLPA